MPRSSTPMHLGIVVEADDGRGWFVEVVSAEAGSCFLQGLDEPEAGYAHDSAGAGHLDRSAVMVAAARSAASAGPEVGGWAEPQHILTGSAVQKHHGGRGMVSAIPGFFITFSS